MSFANRIDSMLPANLGITMAEPKPEPLPLRAQLQERLDGLTATRTAAVKNMLLLQQQAKTAGENVAALEGGIRELERVLPMLAAPVTPPPTA